VSVAPTAHRSFCFARSAPRTDSVRVFGRLLVTHVPVTEDSVHLHLEPARAPDRLVIAK
jgi:hypothetical protein